MATPMIAGNWKMTTTVRGARALVAGMLPGLEAVDGVQVVVCPPFTALEAVGKLLQGSSVALGAQNMYFESGGAYTGEVSPEMVADLCRFVIAGHSERRHKLGETDVAVGKKVAAAQSVGLRPILCVGETLRERDDGDAENVVERQMRLGLAGASAIDGLVVAYEPVWAIGTGAAATPEDAQGIMGNLRGTLATLYGSSAASEVPLLYGGSVDADNVASFATQRDIDGALVGGASLSPESFVPLVRNAAEALV